MDDLAIVAAMVRQDPAGLDGAYRRYADPLYAYSRSLLRDPEAAADVVHDTFLLASRRIGQLRQPDRLRSWLYAIARHECHRVLRKRARTASFAEAPDLPADAPEPGARLLAAQVRELVDAAAIGLAPTDREVIALALRHELSAPDVAAVLGVSTNHAHALLSRARTQLRRALGALLLARGGPEHCDDLAELLSGWDGQLTPLLRKRIARHAEDCPQCRERQSVLLTPDALLPAYTPVPFAAVAEWLRHRPRSTGRHSAARGWRVASGVAAAVAVLILLTVYAFRPEPAQLELSTGGPTPLPTVAQVQAPPGLAAPTGTPSPATAASSTVDPGGTVRAPSGGDEPDLPPTNAPTDPPTNAPPVLVVAFTVSIEQWRVTCQGTTYALAVGARVAGGTLSRATLYWRNSSSGGGLTTPTYRSMTPMGDMARVVVTGLGQQSLAWWVRATAADGRVAETQVRYATNPC